MPTFRGNALATMHLNVKVVRRMCKQNSCKHIFVYTTLVYKLVNKMHVFIFLFTHSVFTVL